MRKLKNITSKIFLKKFFQLMIYVGTIGLLVTGCIRGNPSDDPPIHFNPNMDDQPRYDPQEESPFFSDGASMRVPVPGTLARGDLRQDKAMYEGIDEKGNPLFAWDLERRFFEGAWVHKYNGLYYLSYSTGDTHYLVYATSKSPTGPFVYTGRLLNPVLGWTTHHSIVEFHGKWYLFYHDSSLSKGVEHKRCIKFTEFHYNAAGSIPTLDP